MGKIYIRNKAHKGRCRSLGFYTVLAFSLMAVGAAAWSATVGLEHMEQELTAENSPGEPLAQADTLLSKEPAPQSADSKPRTAETEESAQPKRAASEQTDRDKTVATYFVLPLTGEIIKKFDGEQLQYSETYGDLRLHAAIDIAGEPDSRIKSAGNGVVKQVYEDAATGNTVVIDHGNGITAYYCGLNNVPMVQTGDEVLAGSDLGSLATVPSECAEAPHLHFAMQKDGKWVSPLALMHME